MPSRLNRLAPLCGIVFFVLLLVGIFTSGSSPGAGSSGAKVLAFYTKHRSTQELSDVLFVFASAFLVLFAAVLREHLRAEADGLVTTALVGAGILALGLALLSAIDWALAKEAHRISTGTAQALSTLDNDGVFPALLGGLLFGVCSGLAILRTSVLPRWLGYLGLLFGIASATPASFAGLAALAIWTLIISIILLVRGWSVTDTSPSGFAAGVTTDGSVGQQHGVTAGVAR